MKKKASPKIKFRESWRTNMNIKMKNMLIQKNNTFSTKAEKKRPPQG